jgi:purine-binding chemotaxis protein CheW
MSVTINSYLTFKVGNETFGINVAKVMEIREYQQPQSLPQSLPFVSGVIAYNEEVIPLIDTGIKFGMDALTINTATCMVVLQLVNDVLGKTYRVAILVDTVSDVLESDDTSMKPIADDYRPEYIFSTYKQDDQFIYILNADRVFNQKEVIAILDSIKQLK